MPGRASPEERSGYRAAGHDIEQAKEGSPLPPLATGITLGIWITAMLFLAFVVVPTLFGSCQGPPAT